MFRLQILKACNFAFYGNKTREFGHDFGDVQQFYGDAGAAREMFLYIRKNPHDSKWLTEDHFKSSVTTMEDALENETEKAWVLELRIMGGGFFFGNLDLGRKYNIQEGTDYEIAGG